MSYYVYVHTSPSGKRYVGLTTGTPERRWRKGEAYSHNGYFGSAIKKYGWDSFKHIIYELDTKEEMFYLERYLISFYESHKSEHGYNLTLGGEIGPCGFHHSDEWKKTLSVRLRGEGNHFYGKHLNDEAKNKIRDAQRGRIHSEESKKKVSMKMKGRFAGANHPMYGTHPSDETRRKMSEALSGDKNPMYGKHSNAGQKWKLVDGKRVYYKDNK